MYNWYRLQQYCNYHCELQHFRLKYYQYCSLMKYGFLVYSLPSISIRILYDVPLLSITDDNTLHPRSRCSPSIDDKKKIIFNIWYPKSSIANITLPLIKHHTPSLMSLPLLNLSLYSINPSLFADQLRKAW